MPLAQDEMVKILTACNGLQITAPIEGKLNAHRLKTLVLLIMAIFPSYWAVVDELRPTRREDAMACVGYFIAFVGLAIILWALL
jgi:hypothetical protein